eukprot:gene11138-12137_t
MDCFGPEFYEKVLEEYLSKKGKTAVTLSNNGLKSLENIDVLGSKTLRLNLSGNKISDLTPLQGFSSLIELDLSQNNIESLSTLHPLPTLEFLDLRENKIHSLADLSVIRDLPNLRCLRLIGNPICKSLEYPEELWRLSSSLMSIDFFERSDPRNTNNNNNNKNNDNDNEIVYSDKQIKKMEFEIKALSSTLQVQEEMTSKEGRENTSALKVSIVNQLLFPDNPPTASNTPPLSVAEINKAYDDMTSRFPYLRLLTHWRNEAYKNNVRYLLAQEEMCRLSKQHQKDREQFLLQRRELEAIIYGLENKGKILEKKNSLLEEEKERLNKQLSHQINKTEEVTKQCHQYRDGMTALSKYLISFQRDYHDKESKKVSLLAEKMEEFKDYHNRLDAMKEQIESLGDLLRLKELQLRNSQATLEFERRILRQQHQNNNEQHQPHQPPLPLPQPALIEHSDSKEGETRGVASSSNRLLSEVNISDEGESYLKAVFFRLDDRQPSGIIPIKFLLKAFLNINIDDFPDNIEEDVLSYCSSEGYLLQEALQNDDVLTIFFKNLLHLYAANKDDDVSWGELLLQFLSDNPTNTLPTTFLSPLTRQEIRDLSLRNVVESTQFSTFPYLIRHTSEMKEDVGKLYTTHLKHKEHQGAGDRGLEEQVQRLHLEKKLLNHQLQQLTRQMTRNAEMIRHYFESRLIFFENKEKKHEEEKIVLSEKIIKLEEHVEHLSRTNKHLSEKNEEQRQTYKKEIEEVERRLEEYQNNDHEMNQSTLKQFNDLKLQYDQLQLQCKRKDTQTTLLQRQYDRLKIDYEKCEKERLSNEKKYLYEIQLLQERSNEEMTSLRLQLQESQSLLVQSNQKTIELEEERYALTKRLEGIEGEIEAEKKRGKSTTNERRNVGETVETATSPMPAVPLPPPRSHVQPVSASATSTLSPSLLPRSSQGESSAGEQPMLSQKSPSLLALQQIEQKIARLLNQPPL